ncbi:MAG: hypothetical protein INR71_06530 [Terriglobus roseus]|nr:hypothetical protein [Terriglobus roseus]
MSTPDALDIALAELLPLDTPLDTRPACDLDSLSALALDGNGATATRADTGMGRRQPSSGRDGVHGSQGCAGRRRRRSWLLLWAWHGQRVATTERSALALRRFVSAAPCSTRLALAGPSEPHAPHSPSCLQCCVLCR